MKEEGPYRSYDVYMKAVNEFDQVSNYIILEILHHDEEFHEMANNAAEVLMNVKGLLKLCSTKDYGRGWVLSRSLWKGFKRVRMRDRNFVVIPLMKPAEAAKKQDGDSRNGSHANTQYKNERYDSFKREKLMGTANRNQQLGKELNLDFIYAHGYSRQSLIESSFMGLNAKELDNTIESIDENTYGDEWQMLQEACLLTCLILNETMNSSAREWKWILFDYLKGYYDYLDGRTRSLPISFDTVKTQCSDKISKRCDD